MPDRTKRKILVALDGSEDAFEVVKYISQLRPFQKIRVVLFSVFDPMPEVYWDIEKVPDYSKKMRRIQEWQELHEKPFRECIAKASMKLLESGFSQDAIITKAQERKVGIARDIFREAQKGYWAVLFGRKGAGGIEELPLGGVAIKLLQVLDFVPLCVVGKCLATKKILVPVDGSDSAMRAVDYVGETLAGFGGDVTLLHVIRGEENDFIRLAQEKIAPVFVTARERLAAWGFEEHRVKTRIITGAASRARSIVQEAKEGSYGTIVVGRRGFSQAPEFIFGRVSHKVIQLARKHVIWVVN
jgi:nucleotide-binding universal stress UspA family protein